MENPTALWAAKLAESIPLPDRRLNKRLALILDTLADHSQCSIPQACGNWAATKATYRFLDPPRVRPSDLLEGTARFTASQTFGEAELLIVQDTTSLNFTRRNRIEELGPIDSAGLARGLLVHSTLALDSDGRVRGRLDLQAWVRPKPGESKPEDKESGQWIYGMDRAREAIGSVRPGQAPARLIHIMDREGDCADVMMAVVDAGDSAIIRCAQNRKLLTGNGLAHTQVRAQAVRATEVIALPSRTSRPARSARVEIRSLSTTLLPDREKSPHAFAMAWSLVEVLEADAPEGVEPLHWLLWTLEPTETVEQVQAVVRKYRYRWPVEDYHLTLKSGCQIERLQLGRWESLYKMLLLYASVAARVVGLRDWARQEPEAPAEVLLSEAECQVLRARCDPKGRVKGPLRLGQAVLGIGRLGGHLNRKSDGLPGVRTLWKGLRDLALLVEGFLAAQTLPPKNCG